MIDYDTPTFQDILISRGSGKSDISLITNLELAYKEAMNKTISAPFLSELCRIALYGDVVCKPVNIRNNVVSSIGDHLIYLNQKSIFSISLILK